MRRPCGDGRVLECRLCERRGTRAGAVLAAVAREERALMIVLGAGSRGRSRAAIRARCAAELGELTRTTERAC
jgi:hypothetical protein